MKLSIAAATLALTSSASALTLNGWSPDATKFCYGLPGSLAPVGEFDPLGLAKDQDLNVIKRWREAELQHSRVAMLATVGLLSTEEPIEFHPLFEAATKDIGPAIRHLDEVRAVEPLFFEYLAIFIGSLEINRALQGWKKPDETSVFQDLNDDYYPGDIGFDPLGLKPTDPAKFAEIQTKELQNGRLAMLGMAGMVAQELVNGKEIFVNLGLAADRFNPEVLPVQF
jgi:hypothetical protein